MRDLIDIMRPLSRDAWTYLCLNCEEISYSEDMVRVVEPHGEVTLACGRCGSGEIDDAPALAQRQIG